MTRLPGRTHTDVGVRVLRQFVVHIQTIRVEVTHIHEITIGRAGLRPIVFIRKKPFSCIYIVKKFIINRFSTSPASYRHIFSTFSSPQCRELKEGFSKKKRLKKEMKEKPRCDDFSSFKPKKIADKEKKKQKRKNAAQIEQSLRSIFNNELVATHLINIPDIGIIIS